MIILSMGLLILDLMFTLAGDLPPPRRDADYPPAYALEFMQQPHRECVAETGVSEAAIKRFSDVEIFDDDEKLKCYMGCLFVKAGVSDGNGDLHLGKVLELIPKEFEDIALKMGSRCLKPKGKTPCERAFWFNKCWKLADPVLSRQRLATKHVESRFSVNVSGFPAKMDHIFWNIGHCRPWVLSNGQGLRVNGQNARTPGVPDCGQPNSGIGRWHWHFEVCFPIEDAAVTGQEWNWSVSKLNDQAG